MGEHKIVLTHILSIRNKCIIKTGLFIIYMCPWWTLFLINVGFGSHHMKTRTKNSSLWKHGWMLQLINNIFFIKLLHNVLSQSKICIQAMLKFNSNCLMQLWTYSSFNHFCHDFRNSNSRLLQASDNSKQTWIHTWDCECILNTLNLWWNESFYKIRPTNK